MTTVATRFHTACAIVLLTMVSTFTGLAAATETPLAAPSRGAHMSSVEQRYGAPSVRYPSVGNPQITRWDYPAMIVYFENDRVIHAVVPRAETASN